MIWRGFWKCGATRTLVSSLRRRYSLEIGFGEGIFEDHVESVETVG